MTVPDLELNDHRTIPQLGFGVYKVDPAEAADVVGSALDVGYRSIDTAALYGNETEVGLAIARSGLDRTEVFVTTKLWNDAHGYEPARRAFDASRQRLALDRVDLYLIHWPCPSQDRYVETWEALIALRDQGVVHSIGVSNFQPDHLRRIIDATGVVPAVNQVELHPHFQQPELRAVHRELGIATEAWAPLGAGKGVLDEPALADIARRLGVTPAQVVLRWHLDLGNIAIPKSVHPDRQRENFDVFGFELSDDDHERIGALDRGQRNGPDPDRM